MKNIWNMTILAAAISLAGTSLAQSCGEVAMETRPVAIKKAEEKPVATKGEADRTTKVTTSTIETAAKAEKKTIDMEDDFKKAVDTFKSRYPKTKVKSFALTPVAGIYEAAVGKEVVYFDSTARFLFSGRLLDMDKGVDLTDKRLKDLRRIDFKSLPLERAVKTVYGKGTKKLAVFTDVDCPFSRKLAETLEGLKDATVYTFLFPLESIHPQARSKSEAVWCAKDSSQALKTALKGEAVAQTVANNPICEPPVTETIKWAQKHGIAGTPTLINEAGDRISGALPLDKLNAFIEGK